MFINYYTAIVIIQNQNGKITQVFISKDLAV